MIRGRLPSSEAVRRFIEEADPDLAKKVGAYASSLLVEALRNVNLSQDAHTA